MSQSAEKTVYEIEFRGNGTEYFRIWIVNVLLSIVTLGIYSAWAKVRNNRYIYSNTYLGDANFEYLADPITILKGRIIAFFVVVVLFLVNSFLPVIGVFLGLLALLALPFIIARSLAFSRRMTSHRNIQFRFHGTYGGAFMAFLVWPLLGVLTLGILVPLEHVKRNNFIVGNSAYGTASFRFTATYGDYFFIYLSAFGLMVCAVLLGIIPIIGLLLMLLGIFAVSIYIRSQFHNLLFQSTFLKEHGFTSTVTTIGFAKVVVVNSLLTVLTLGLYLPFAKVRKLKYVCSQLEFNAVGPIDEFVAAEKQNVSSLGEELGDALDVDVGIGI